MMFQTNAFGCIMILMILYLNMATNDGEMLFHFANSNLDYCYACAIYPTSPYIYAMIYVHPVEVDIHHSKIDISNNFIA